MGKRKLEKGGLMACMTSVWPDAVTAKKRREEEIEIVRFISGMWCVLGRVKVLLPT